MIKPQTSNLHRGQTLTCLFKSTWSLCQTPQFPSPKASVWGEVRDRGHTSHFSFQHGAQWIHSLRWNCQRGALFELSGLLKKNIQQKWCELWCMSASHLLSAQSTLKTQKFLDRSPVLLPYIFILFTKMTIKLQVHCYDTQEVIQWILQRHKCKES